MHNKTIYDQIEDEIPALRRFAMALTREPAAADDLAQDTLERALNKLDMFEPGTNLRAWLFTIARRLFINERRRQARQGPHVPIEDWQGALQCRPRQEVPLEVEDFARCFGQLPSGDQELLIMAGVDRMPYEDIARVMGTAIGTVKSRVSRARSRLRRIEEEVAAGARAVTRTQAADRITAMMC